MNKIKEKIVKSIFIFVLMFCGKASADTQIRNNIEFRKECSILDSMDLTIKTPRGWIRVCSNERIIWYCNNFTDLEQKIICKCIKKYEKYYINK